ncbi:MAG: PIN domain-containing protein [Nitrososphaerales archaeon]
MTTGLDTNVLCYVLDPAFSEHGPVAGLFRSLSQERTVAVNPTVLHECYHTLIYSQRWVRDEARRRLVALLRHPYVEFYNQTRSVSLLALNLAGKYQLGGRDSVILANFLANHCPVVYTHDAELLKVGELSWRTLSMRLEDPVAVG